MSCKHNWMPKPIRPNQAFVTKDEWICTKCEAVGDLDWSSIENGFTPVKERPLAKVLDFMEFKARKAAKSRGVSGG